MRIPLLMTNTSTRCLRMLLPPTSCRPKTFLMLCDIEGVVLIVTPRLLSTQPEESFHNALACDNIAHVGGVDVRILTPLLIHCSTEAARLQLTAAVSGVEAYIGEWSLLCGRPVVLQEGVVELGLSLQVC